VRTGRGKAGMEVAEGTATASKRREHEWKIMKVVPISR